MLYSIRFGVASGLSQGRPEADLGDDIQTGFGKASYDILFTQKEPI